MAGQKQVDWERIEPHWRAGIKSVLQIAADYERETGRKVSHTAINKHFKGLGVPRDLSAKIRAKAESMVSVAMVSGMVSAETTVSDAKIISNDAEIMATVMLSHRTDIKRGRKLVMALFEELELQTGNVDLLKDLAVLMLKDGGDSQDKRNEVFNKVISLSSRAGTMKTLAESLKSLVAMERQAFNIADEQRDTDTPASISITF